MRETAQRQADGASKAEQRIQLVVREVCRYVRLQNSGRPLQRLLMHFRCLYAPAVDVCSIRQAFIAEPLSFGTRCHAAGVASLPVNRSCLRWVQCSIRGAVDDGRKTGSCRTWWNREDFQRRRSGVSRRLPI